MEKGKTLKHLLVTEAVSVGLKRGNFALGACKPTNV